MGNSGAIVAVDVTDDKLRRVRENVERLGIGIVTCALADGEAFAAQAGPRFDAVLVDAPCTNTGVLGRRVEARWRLNDAAMAELTTRQRGLLRAGMRAVRPGGRLVYSTCSLEPEENGGLVAACLSGSDFLLEDERLIMPWAEGDGAYMARLRRREAAS
jgi:16S rRNA (cytosine967-C5)-methyltransferase